MFHACLFPGCREGNVGVARVLNLRDSVVERQRLSPIHLCQTANTRHGTCGCVFGGLVLTAELRINVNTLLNVTKSHV